jgi:hypothetical protein
MAELCLRILVLPYMASLVAKKKASQLYYYVVESARVDGKPPYRPPDVSRHRRESKIRVHAFYCMLGISLLQYVHRQSQSAWPHLTVEQLLEQLTPMQQFTLLYPPPGGKGPNCIATVLSRQTLLQQALAHSLGLNELCCTQRG